MEELIKLAKEKGFQPKTVTTKYTVDVILGSRKNVLVNDTCDYLVLCEIQKWIREIHSIEVYVRPFINVENGFKHYRCFIVWFDGTMYRDGLCFTYDTHEQALEVGLLEALKLIKTDNE